MLKVFLFSSGAVWFTASRSKYQDETAPQTSSSHVNVFISKADESRNEWLRGLIDLHPMGPQGGSGLIVPDDCRTGLSRIQYLISLNLSVLKDNFICWLQVRAQESVQHSVKKKTESKLFWSSVFSINLVVAQSCWPSHSQSEAEPSGSDRFRQVLTDQKDALDDERTRETQSA